METQTEQTEKKNETKKIAGLLFVGSMFIGMAAGFVFGNFMMYMFGGMGLGFILMAVVHLSESKKRG
jgi:uncharacterized membrane protein YraQ (UPF0718 family)